MWFIIDRPNRKNVLWFQPWNYQWNTNYELLNYDKIHTIITVFKRSTA